MTSTIAHLSSKELTKTLIDFCKINALDPNEDSIDDIVRFLKYKKSSVYSETLKKSLYEWTDGTFENIRKPKKLNAHFISSIIEEYMTRARNIGISKRQYENEEEDTKHYSKYEIDSTARFNLKLFYSQYAHTFHNIEIVPGIIDDEDTMIESDQYGTIDKVPYTPRKWFKDHKRLHSITFMSHLYDWLIDENMFDPFEFEDSIVMEKQTELSVYERTYGNQIAGIKSKNNLVGKDIIQAAFVALYFDKLINETHK